MPFCAVAVLDVMAERWTEQWARMERYYAKIHNARFGLMAPEALWTPEQRANVHDDMMTYFVHAYHLRDWLKADGIHVTGEFASKEVLRICADLANATKHVELTNPRVGQPRKDNTSVSLIFRNGQLTIGADLQIRIHERVLSAYGMATQVRKEWISLLRTRGLTPEVKDYKTPNLRTLKPVPEPILDADHSRASPST